MQKEKKFRNTIEDIKKRYYNDEDVSVLEREYREKLKDYCNTAVPVQTGFFGEPFLVTVIEYDREDAWGCRPYSALVSPASAADAQKTILDAIEEYYDNSGFYDEVTDLSDEDLIRIFLAEADFAVMRYFVEGVNAESECRQFSKY